MYKRILIPLDGSQLAEQSIPYARSIARAFNARIDLLQVIEPFNAQVALSVPKFGAIYDKLIQDMRSGAETYLNNLAFGLKNAGFTVTYKVEEGNAAESIINYVSTGPDSLIAMSAHGRSGIAKWLLGSVTTKILHKAGCSVLVMHSKNGASIANDKDFRTAILPLNGSAFNEQSIDEAVSLAKKMELKVVVAQVIPSVTHYEGTPELSKLDTAALVKEATVKAEDYLAKIRKKLQQQGLTNISVRTIEGYPAPSIIELTNEYPASVVILTTHGKFSSGGWMLGSTTDKVLRQCSSPVLVVRRAESKK